MRVGRVISLFSSLVIAWASPALGSPTGIKLAEDPALSGAELVDAVVAVVGRRIITLSQLRTETRLALAEHGAVDAADGPLGDGLLASTLDLVIGEDLVEEEASRLQVFEVPAGATRGAVAALTARFPSEEAYRAFLERNAIHAETVQSILRRGLRAQRYLENRLRLELAAQGNSPRAAPPVSAGDRAASDGEGYFQRKRIELLASGLLTDLRARAHVRILLDLRHAGTAPLDGLGQPDPASGPSRLEGAAETMPDGIAGSAGGP
ncbi:MAG: SurA N-terminal domain-containing protein [Deltaproteobacteria bacterium]